MTRAPRPPTDRANLGRDGESIAAEHLQARGMVVLARNWRLGSGAVRGELDLVCRDGEALVFVEVKTRRGDRFGGPLVAVTPRKQARLRSLAVAFVQQTGLRARRLRFDVVGIVSGPDGVEVHHVVDAF